MPSAAFRSSSAQRARARSQDTPGAGAYAPNMASVEPSSANSAAQMRSKGQRFPTERATTDGGVGPGTYEAHVDGSLAASVAKSVERMSRSNPGFGSRQPARELPYQKEQADLPGPGACEGVDFCHLHTVVEFFSLRLELPIVPFRRVVPTCTSADNLR